MENNQVEKSQAELYREERKKRMENAAKKNAKKSPQMTKAKKVIGKVVAIVLAVVVCLAAVYGIFNFFGIPQKVLTAAKIGDERVTVAKYNFYYMDMYLNTYNQSQSYDSQYGAGYGAMYTGYDSSKSPMEQEYPGTLEDFEGESATWADYFRVQSLKYLQTYLAYAKLAKEAGMTLDEDELADIDEQVESIRSSAESNDYSLDRYLTKIYGKGVNEKLLREVMEERQLAYKYAQQKQEDVETGVTDAQIEEEYTANPAEYALVTLNGFVVSADTSAIADDATDDEKTAATEAAMADAKAKAEGYAAKVNSAETLLEQAKANNSTATEASVKLEDVTGTTLASTFSQAASDWAYAAERAVGDVTVVETSNGYAVLYMAVLPHKDMSKPVDVRHILIQFDTTTDESGNTVALTSAEKEAYYQQAQAIYNQFLENPTEENFATLANNNSDDTGSNTNGGLYEDVHVGDMVTAFNDWCFDPNRKPGDSGIIETNYGYHVMYYVGNDNEETWKSTVRSALASDALSAFDDEIVNGETYKINESDLMIKWSVSQLEDLITTRYINY
ncbi:MAG: peptidylprolyl isomerase [Ruminococcus sp.]|nr:peptidylprolyl isomerase [Ruminococcus sp.]